MKTHTDDLDLRQTLAECHQRIRELRAALAASQGRVVELEGQKQALEETVRNSAPGLWTEDRVGALPPQIRMRPARPIPPSPESAPAAGETESPPPVLALMLIVITSTNMPVTGSAGYCRFRGGLGT
ncbi:MAG: hypothetical protein M0Z36_10435 [Thermaerobacter sp.]|nr:hypothetical protein [Thermaerobacter sp.]